MMAHGNARRRKYFCRSDSKNLMIHNQNYIAIMNHIQYYYQNKGLKYSWQM